MFYRFLQNPRTVLIIPWSRVQVLPGLLFFPHMFRRVGSSHVARVFKGIEYLCETVVAGLAVVFPGYLGTGGIHALLLGRDRS